MATFSASDVKELREITGSGMMDCKKALTEADGDKEKAIEILRSKGLATAAKKASRVAAEGIVKEFISDDSKVGVVVEVNSETDFVAKNADFQSFVADVAKTIADTNPADVDALLATKIANGENTVGEALTEKIATIGENMNIRRFERIETAGVVVAYIHAAGKIGVLVEANTDNANDDVKESLKNIAMQVAAMNPQYISKDDISSDELAKLKAITIDSAINDPASLPKPILTDLFNKAVEGKLFSDEDAAIYEEKKSDKYLFNFLSDAAKATLADLGMNDKAAIVENKIFSGLVEGRIAKQIKEISLMEQTYVKAEDGKQSVAKYLESVDKSLKISRLVRFETGEGLEKKEENFADEVASMVK